MSDATTFVRAEPEVTPEVSAPSVAMNSRGGASTATAPSASPPSRGPRSEKIANEYLQPRAIVYVRQSTQQQVLEHRETTARLYALVDRAVALGWPRSAVEVIDDDQRVSGSSIEGRSGFQRLLTEVAADRVGVILGLEMSRLARSCKDWHALLELCSIDRTLLANADGLYDRNQYNDRLLSGLKGTMSEAELHILRSRLQQGMWNKAERGDVLNHPPTGALLAPPGFGHRGHRGHGEGLGTRPPRFAAERLQCPCIVPCSYQQTITPGGR